MKFLTISRSTPGLAAQIEFTEWTPDGHLRHSRFGGLREDKEGLKGFLDCHLLFKSCLLLDSNWLQIPSETKPAPWCLPVDAS